MPLHVSSRSAHRQEAKIVLYCTVSGIITPIGGCPVHRLREDWMEYIHVSSTSARRQEAKIVLYSLWYHHTYRWLSRAQVAS